MKSQDFRQIYIFSLSIDSSPSTGSCPSSFSKVFSLLQLSSMRFQSCHRCSSTLEIVSLGAGQLLATSLPLRSRATETYLAEIVVLASNPWWYLFGPHSIWEYYSVLLNIVSVVAVCDEFFAGKLVGTRLRLCKQKDDDEDSEHRFSLTKTSAFSSCIRWRS